MKVFYVLFFSILQVFTLSGQTSSIYGKITDEYSGEELLYANIVIEKNGIFVTGGSTDFEGNYSIPLDPGVYELKPYYTQYRDTIIKEIEVKPNTNTKLDIQLFQKTQSTKAKPVVHYKSPLIAMSAVSEGDAVTIYGSRKTLYGSIKDKESGNNIPNAKIFLFKKNGAIITEKKSNDEGKYSIRVDTGDYKITVSCLGYFNTIINQFALNHQTSSILNIELIQNNKSIKHKETGATKKDNTNSHFKSKNNSGKPDQGQNKNNSSASSIYGKVTDEETGEELLYANIVLKQNDHYIAGTSTDFEGNYSMPVEPGVYNLSISYTGYPDRIITDIKIKADEGTKLDIMMQEGLNIEVFTVRCIYIPILDQDPTSRGKTIYHEEIRNQPQKNINQLLLNTPGVSIANF